ncbi:MAG: tRNA (adenosine(37)-N6)-threonylcarbamoyltransferase complex ATPase subunit type 1 TsaE [Leptospiraceae bacterium]|nr:tRNA (adenosine(37)-N6)-threonylcarbamoyltransferase complex ATPase subunit type 1 TsaE [Leptospiraceae bacterium]MCP5497313.1 tRNA (adenosine(37)-N6)-threonylcarbamoyltransferase complex ATPase subunit type 1 TsaE [Leptospiraceae bacterium]
MEFICKQSELEIPVKFIRERIEQKHIAFPVLLLSGEMGSGKTTFTSTFVKSYNPGVWVNSPSFNLMNEYDLQNGLSIYHFDLYRLHFADELEDLGFEEYWGKRGISIVEWWEIAKDYFLEEVIQLEFSVVDEFTRKIVVK